ncbi:MAG: rhodanese-like domain-containing protein [Flavobacteriaceae bacterium]|nr:rhodanese-like domain-containing protein [Flavobacteriaceae bacterium]
MRITKSILIALITISFVSCSEKQKKDIVVQQTVQEKTIELISVSELEKVDKSVQLIDVRTPKEYNEGYIKNAKNINFFEDNFIEEMSKLNKNKPVYVYCRGGGRSGRASKKLREAGFTKVYDLNGGFLNWKSEGKEISK